MHYRMETYRHAAFVARHAAGVAWLDDDEPDEQATELLANVFEAAALAEQLNRTAGALTYGNADAVATARLDALHKVFEALDAMAAAALSEPVDTLAEQLVEQARDARLIDALRGDPHRFEGTRVLDDAVEVGGRWVEVDGLVGWRAE